MLRRITIIAVIALTCIAGQMPVWAQSAQGKFTAEQYRKALWMVTRMYGGQRSGYGPNWLIMEHSNPAYRTSFTKDADVGHDLEGGWFDCGDHVLFGQTFFFSAYMLAKAYETFPTGFHDLYNGKDYSDYMASKDWSINGGSPNGIPDLLEELKYATDWMIKATPNGSTFYYEKGEGGPDHATWVTAGKMSTQSVEQGGEPRKMWKNPNDGVMASFAAGTLAIMSKIYRKYDAEYADLCLTHAKNAYQYANSNKNNSSGAASGGYYGAHKDPATVFVTAASEMYMATGEDTYKNAIDNSQIKGHWHVLDYSNSHDLSAYAAAMALPDKRTDHLKLMQDEFVSKYTNPSNINGEKVSTLGGGWGQLRYAGNTAFATALYTNAMGTNQHDQFIYDQVDYVLGANNAKQSFVVGFCEGCTKVASKPHHRNVFLNDENPDDNAKNQMTIPERNRYFGYLVGGNRNSDQYVDDVNSYVNTEGGIDYNAGLLGALAYIVSKLDPADTSKFGKPVVTPVPTRLVISTSDDPSNTSAFLRDTVSDLNVNPLYAYVFDQDNNLMTLSGGNCELVTWSFNGGALTDTGCVYAPIIDAGIKTNLTVTYVFAGADRPSISRTVVTTNVSVLARNSLAKNGYAISVKPGTVTFRTAGDLKISKVSVFNLQGRQVFTKSGKHSEVIWKNKTRAKGMYMVKMTLNNGAVVQQNLLLK